MSVQLDEIRKQAAQAAEEVCTAGKLEAGDLFVVGCSSSEVLGDKIGTHTNVDVAEALFDGIYGARFRCSQHCAANNTPFS